MAIILNYIICIELMNENKILYNLSAFYRTCEFKVLAKGMRPK